MTSIENAQCILFNIKRILNLYNNLSIATAFYFDQTDKTLQIFMKSSFPEKSDTRPLPAIINRFFLMMVRMENRMIRSNTNMVFGSSVFCVAGKENDRLS